MMESLDDKEAENSKNSFYFIIVLFLVEKSSLLNS